ncbi:MAG: DUF1464 family protein [Chloroflexi bacterium]|nr:DUF1464 family protein [Chloroflexota bacterium]
MRSLGIDPGTMSFDFCLLAEDGSVLAETSIPSTEIMARPLRLVDVVRELRADIVVGPSGYGVPVCTLRAADEAVLQRLLPADEGEVAVNEGIRSALRLLRQEGAPVVFTPGVVHLPTVPEHRKLNRFDMGTADKLAVAFLALAERTRRQPGGGQAQTFVLLEIGFGFTAAVAVVEGRVVDGIGGSMSFGGCHSSGFVDAELAYRRGKVPYLDLFRYGAAELAGEALVEDWPPAGPAASVLVERALQTACALLPIVGPGQPVVLSGRLADVDWVRGAVERGLAPWAATETIVRRAGRVKAAAEGSARVGLALLGGAESALAVEMGLVPAERLPVL